MMNIDMTRLGIVVLNTLQVGIVTGLPSLGIILLHRRFRRKTRDVPLACAGAAVIAVTLGILVAIGGIGHSFAVVSIALRNTKPYGALEILRFTTGAMLLYTGVMNIALCTAIKAGRRWAIGVSVAINLLFWLHLLFVLPLPGTGTSVPIALGMWSVYLLWLCAAVIASRRKDKRPQLMVETERSTGTVATAAVG